MSREIQRRESKLQHLTMEALAPKLSTLSEPLTPDTLVVRFSDSAAPMEQVGKAPLQAPALHPAKEGEWKWVDDRLLRFQPKTDWPADAEYRVTLPKGFLPAHKRIAKREAVFRTQPFEVQIHEETLYQNPRKPAEKQVTATLRFTHPVNREELERKLGMRSVNGSEVFASGGGKPEIEYGLFDRIVHVRSPLVKLPANEDYVEISVPKGLGTADGVAHLAGDVDTKVKIPDRYRFLRIESAVASIVTRESDPEQALVVQTTAAVSTKELESRLTLSLLPPTRPAEGKRHEIHNYNWESPNDITDLVPLSPVKLEAIPSEEPYTTLHSFRFRVPKNGHLYLKIASGVRGPDESELGQPFASVMPVPIPAKSIAFEQKGGLLSLKGEKTLSIATRGLDGFEIRVAAIKRDQFHHFASQTRGEFQNAGFRSGYFDEENISIIWRQTKRTGGNDLFTVNRTPLSFPADLNSASGLYMISLRPWDPVNDRCNNDSEDSRVILVTDLGLVLKRARDGAVSAFTQSIQNGDPIEGTLVELLAKNGGVVGSATTDATGRVDLKLEDNPPDERKAVVMLAHKGNDVSILPLWRDDRVLDFSRFETDGVWETNPDTLSAHIFTERGIYRPGDSVHVGVILQRENWGAIPSGLPIELEAIDGRGEKVWSTTAAVPESRMVEALIPTRYESSSGSWRVSAYLPRVDRSNRLYLGGAGFTLKEFFPDRMRMELEIPSARGALWIAPGPAEVKVKLTTLYGTPAGNRRLKTTLKLEPSAFSFEGFPGFTFHRGLRDPEKPPKTVELELPEIMTNDAGEAVAPIDLTPYREANFRLYVTVEAFEADSGRSLTRRCETLVSSLSEVIGTKLDLDLSFVKQGTDPRVEIIALDNKGKRVSAPSLKLTITEKKWISALRKMENGNFGYESVKLESQVSSSELPLTPEGIRQSLPTDRPGTFAMEIQDATDRPAATVPFTVAGEAERNEEMERNSELEIALDRKECEAGETVTLSIRAPYHGAGLITVENEHVIAHQWFRAAGGASMHEVRIPENIEGTVYVNVAFTRAIDSPEIYTSPLSYGVGWLTVGRQKRNLGIELASEEKLLPGRPLPIRYRAKAASRIVVFAVDEGILQVTDFETPDPLAHAFRKHALTVETSQLLDLLLPEFSLLRRKAAPGGDGDALAKNLNPFRRVTKDPVVFWSGILEAGPDWKETIYHVPDYFDGTLKIMAVGVSADFVGNSERATLVRSPYVISPVIPPFAAPGDRFKAMVEVTNLVEGLDHDASVTLKAEASGSLQLEEAAFDARIANGGIHRFEIPVKVLAEPGNAELRFTVSGEGQEVVRSETLSVRPASPFATQVVSGTWKGGNKALPFERDMLNTHAKRDLVLAATPLGLTRGLAHYLRAYPHGCTEQTTSTAMCRLLTAEEFDFAVEKETVADQMEYAFQSLRSRQGSSGAFGYWAPAQEPKADFLSLYVMRFLVEANDAGFAPPRDMMNRGMEHIRQIAGLTPHSVEEARSVAQAIYLLTREGVVAANQLVNLKHTLRKRFKGRWESDILCSYLAGASALLQKPDVQMARAFRTGKLAKAWDGDYLNSALALQAQHIALLALHYPGELKLPDDLEPIVALLQEGRFNTYSAAHTIVALKSVAAQRTAQGTHLAARIRGAKGEVLSQSETDALILRAEAALNAKDALLETSGQGPFYYQACEAGFDKEPPSTARRDGLEITRLLASGDGREAVTEVRTGDPLTITLRIRSLTGRPIENVAITELLPGGFEIAEDSIKPGLNPLPNVDYAEVREDRVVLFLTAGSNMREFTFKVKPVCPGEFRVPPPYAESMYDRRTMANGVAGRIVVTPAK